MYYQDTMDLDIKYYLEESMTIEGLMAYNIYISDPVKFRTNTAIFLQRDKFFYAYNILFREYTSSFINAFMLQNAGFLNISDSSHAYINWREDLVGYGYIQTAMATEVLEKYDIYQISFFPKIYLKIVNWANNNTYLSMPILGILMTPATWFYLSLFYVVYIIKNKKIQWLIPISFLGGYFLTLLLGPTVQLRYIFPLMLTVPIIYIYYIYIEKIEEEVY